MNRLFARLRAHESHGYTYQMCLEHGHIFWWDIEGNPNGSIVPNVNYE